MTVAIIFVGYHFGRTEMENTNFTNGLVTVTIRASHNSSANGKDNFAIILYSLHQHTSAIKLVPLNCTLISQSLDRVCTPI